MTPLEIGSLAYLAIGIGTAAVWPLRKSIVEAIRETRGTNFANEMMGVAPPSTMKLTLFALFICLGAILLWPIFSVSVIRNQIREPREASLIELKRRQPEELEERLVGSDAVRSYFIELWDAEDGVHYHRAIVDRTDSRGQWTIYLPSRFKKDIRNVDRRLQERLMAAMATICDSPLELHGDTRKPLDGALSGMWRFRIGDFRVIYRPDVESKTVTMVAFAHRGEAYARIRT